MDWWLKSTMDAVAILHDKLFDLEVEQDYDPDKAGRANTCLLHAIRYLSRPERRFYPKVRYGTKTRPVTR